MNESATGRSDPNHSMLACSLGTSKDLHWPRACGQALRRITGHHHAEGRASGRRALDLLGCRSESP